MSNILFLQAFIPDVVQPSLGLAIDTVKQAEILGPGWQKASAITRCTTINVIRGKLFGCII